MNNLKSGSLEIEVKESNGKVSVLWKGVSDERDPSSFLNPFLDRVTRVAKGAECDVAFEKLEYMNSSTVQPIVQFIKKLNENEIKTLITYDAGSDWQPASFKALVSLSKMMPYISVKGK